MPNELPKSDIQSSNSVSNYDSIIKSSSITAAPGDDPSVQFVTVAVVIFVTLAATVTLLAITVYIRKAQKRRHTMW